MANPLPLPVVVIGKNEAEHIGRRFELMRPACTEMPVLRGASPEGFVIWQLHASRARAMIEERQRLYALGMTA